MKSFLSFLALLLIGAPTFATDLKANYAVTAFKALSKPATAPMADPKAKEKASQSLQSSNLLFVENNGQVVDNEGKLHPEILFTAKAAGTQVYVTGNSIHYVFTKVEMEAQTNNNSERPLLGPETVKSLSTRRFTLELVGANTNPVLLKQEANPFYESYYLPHCPNGVVAHSYQKFTLKQVYPGVDWVIYSNGQGLKYDFVLGNGSDTEKIKLKINDADASLNAEGDLVMKTPLGEVVEDKPLSFQGGKQLETNFKHLGNQTFGFEVSNANANEPLTIDPAVAWATYYGANNYDYGYSCAIDADANVYFAGSTQSNQFPVVAAFQATFGGIYDAYLVKLNSVGQRLWATYYGGSDWEVGNYCGIGSEATGIIYLAGYTASTNLPVSGAYQSTFAGGNNDAFLMKFDVTGSRLWATYYGGSNDDWGLSCTSDAGGNVYLTGYSASTNLPVGGAFQSTNAGNTDAFLIKFTASGGFLWATYYGGTNADFGNSCVHDAAGNVYVAGYTRSSNLPVSGAFQQSFGGDYDAFLVKFSSSGSLMWATYYGGSGYDRAQSCAINFGGNIHIAGYTSSSNLPIPAGTPFQSRNAGAADAFVVKFSSSGSFMWATYYGGTREDNSNYCAVDALGNVYLAGTTSSTNFPIEQAFQRTYGGGVNDAFLVKLNSSGRREWATYYGGRGDEQGQACAIYPNGNIYLAGNTNSIDLPVVRSFQTNNAGLYDAFFLKLLDDDAVSSLPDTQVNNSLTLHPNPATNQLQLSSTNSLLEYVMVLDPLGRTVLSAQDLPNNTLDISALASGTYMVRVISTDGVVVRKLVKE